MPSLQKYISSWSAPSSKSYFGVNSVLYHSSLFSLSLLLLLWLPCHFFSRLKSPALSQVPFSKSTTILGLQITSSSNYAKHTSSKKAIGHSRLNRLRRFHKLSLQRKRHLYLALVRPAMIYPTTPLNATNAPIKLQAVQNRALNWITGLERTNAEHLHSLANIPPLNVVFHKQASKTWSTLRQFHPSLYQSLSSPTPQLGRRSAILFKSSRQQAEGNEPPPRFRTTGALGPSA